VLVPARERIEAGGCLVLWARRESTDGSTCMHRISTLGFLRTGLPPRPIAAPDDNCLRGRKDRAPGLDVGSAAC
jgi:hypothetical protein